MSKARNEKEERTALSAVIAMLLIAAALHTADGWARGQAEPPSVQVQAQQINYGDASLIYDMSVPVVTGFDDAKFERALNTRISEQVAKDKSDAESYAKEFMQRVNAGTMMPYDCVYNVWFAAKCTKGVLSLKVTTLLDNGGTGMPRTVYYNADIAKCEMLSLGDLFIGNGYKTRINRVIVDWIERDPDSYGEPFGGVSKDTKFFISNGRLFIAFAKYEIAAGALGEPELEIPAETFYDLLKPEYRALLRGKC